MTENKDRSKLIYSSIISESECHFESSEYASYFSIGSASGSLLKSTKETPTKRLKELKRDFMRGDFSDILSTVAKVSFFTVIFLVFSGIISDARAFGQTNDFPSLGNFPNFPATGQQSAPTQIALMPGAGASSAGSSSNGGEPSLPKLPSTSAPPPPGTKPASADSSLPLPSPNRVNPVGAAPSTLPNLTKSPNVTGSSSQAPSYSSMPGSTGTGSPSLSNTAPKAGTMPPLPSNSLPAPAAAPSVRSAVPPATNTAPSFSSPNSNRLPSSGYGAAAGSRMDSGTGSRPLSTSPSLKGNGTAGALGNAKKSVVPQKNAARIELVPVPENNVFNAFLKMPDPQRSAIVGRKMTLADFIKNTGNVYQRNRQIRDWWDLTEKFALYNVYLTRLQDVQLCLDRASSRNDPLLASNQQVAINEMKTAELDFIEAQFAFCARYPELYASLRGTFQMDEVKRKTTLGTILPLPADVPSTGQYNTRQSEIAKSRRLSQRADFLAQTIPLQYQAVSARIEGSNQAYAGLKSLFQKQNVSEEVLFAALDRATEAKVEMVRSIIEYNKMMADYSAETVSAYVRGVRFFATINQRYQETEVKTTGVRSVGYDTTLYRQSSQTNQSDLVSDNQAINPPEKLSVTGATGQNPEVIKPMSGAIPKSLEDGVNHPVVSNPSALKITTGDENSDKMNLKTRKFDQTDSTGIKPVETIKELPPTLPSLPIIKTSPDSSQEKKNKSQQRSPDNEKTTRSKDSSISEPIIRGQMPNFGTFRNERIALNQTPARSDAPMGTGESVAVNSAETLSPEVQTQIQEIITTLYRINASRSGAGDSPIVEMPISLRQAVGNTQGVSERLAIVEAYWQLRTQLAELEIEKMILKVSESGLNDLPSKLRSFQGTPDLNALTGSWRAEILRSQAKIDEMKIAVREGQIRLLNKMGRTTENGWPIPSSLPFWGPTYRLETAGARTSSFLLLTELVLIPEKLQTVRATASRLGTARDLFVPDIGTWSKVEDGWRFLKFLDNKRKNSIFLIELLESLNCSIARYVSYYSATPVPNEIFVKSLIGTSL